MNRGEEYEREVISEEGTFTTWYTLADEVLDEILFDAGVRELAFPVCQVRVPAQTVLEQRRLWAAIRQGKAIDPLAVEERLIHLTRSILGTGVVSVIVSPTVVERATEYLLAHFNEPVSLSRVARAAGASVSYLSRAFHSASGMTMSAYRQRVRLTRSLDLLPQYQGNVTDLALELGYSSHSHFTSCFRSLFAMSPTQFLGSVRSS
jgi:AraC-like DNA-binding protein